MFLGSPRVVGAGPARSKAKDLLAAVRLGNDPAAEKSADRANAAHAVGALLPRFLARQRARLKPRSLQETVRHLEQHVRPLHAYPIEKVDRRQVAGLLSDIADASGPAAANRVRASLSAFFTWAAREGLAESNPVGFTNRQTEIGARTRVPTDSELAQIWRAAGDGQYGVIVKLLMLTGARRNEIGDLRWSEVDFEAATATLPPERTKNKRPHLIPLSRPALALLKERWETRDPDRDLVFGARSGPFSGWSRSKRELDQRLADAAAPVENWVLHDFRRSISTTLHERFGVQPAIVESVLGHAGGHQGGVAGIYNKSTYIAERGRALERWADHLLAVVTGKPAKAQVVTLGRKRK